MITLSTDMLIGLGVGFVLAMLLFTGQSLLGQSTRQSPFGCLLGIICLAIGLVLLTLNGYLQFGGF